MSNKTLNKERICGARDAFKLSVELASKKVEETNLIGKISAKKKNVNKISPKEILQGKIFFKEDVKSKEYGLILKVEERILNRSKTKITNREFSQVVAESCNEKFAERGISA
ncbi:MAG: hypothetical protein E7374_01890 [Clostridiales bacterium]|nr:hypothetical protein [Clostridiales bacterium]